MPIVRRRAAATSGSSANSESMRGSASTSISATVISRSPAEKGLADSKIEFMKPATRSALRASLTARRSEAVARTKPTVAAVIPITSAAATTHPATTAMRLRCANLRSR